MPLMQTCPELPWLADDTLVSQEIIVDIVTSDRNQKAK